MRFHQRNMFVRRSMKDRRDVVSFENFAQAPQIEDRADFGLERDVWEGIMELSIYEK